MFARKCSIPEAPGRSWILYYIVKKKRNAWWATRSGTAIGACYFDWLFYLPQIDWQFDMPNEGRQWFRSKFPTICGATSTFPFLLWVHFVPAKQIRCIQSWRFHSASGGSTRLRYRPLLRHSFLLFCACLEKDKLVLCCEFGHLFKELKSRRPLGDSAKECLPRKKKSGKDTKSRIWMNEPIKIIPVSCWDRTGWRFS